MLLSVPLLGGWGDREGAGLILLPSFAPLSFLFLCPLSSSLPLGLSSSPSLPVSVQEPRPGSGCSLSPPLALSMTAWAGGGGELACHHGAPLSVGNPRR